MSGSSEEGNGERTPETRLWLFLLFGTIGATAYGAIILLSKVSQVREKVAWLYSQLGRSPLYSSWRSTTGGLGKKNFREETVKKHSRRMQEEYEDEMERLSWSWPLRRPRRPCSFLDVPKCTHIAQTNEERIKKMQSVFHRARNKSKGSPESWRHDGPVAYQHFQRDDWYWKTDPSYKDHKKHSGASGIQHGIYLLSHHYSILGLDRFRRTPYTDEEIKTAFREKAKQYHPDQNQSNKEASEAKFKEVMMSYEAIKLERKNKK